MLLMPALCITALAGEPDLEAEMRGEPAEVIRAWQQAMADRDIEHRGLVENLLAGDHPALPTRVSYTFSGAARLGLAAPFVNGELEVERTGAGVSTVRLSYIPSVVEKDNAKLPKLSAKLLAEAEALLGDAQPAPILADPTLADPEACGARLSAFIASPIPGARQTILLSLPQIAAPCQRQAVNELVRDDHGKQAVTTWLLEAYATRPEAERGALVPLVLVVPEPDDALLEILDAEEQRLLRQVEDPE
ncbi:MAG: hypothetical protein H6740_24140 [Alphaproteobacteria bacterium]|nr:hypothetical protein [Alphaproteobacteria bacterium]